MGNRPPTVDGNFPATVYGIFLGSFPDGGCEGNLLVKLFINQWCSFTPAFATIVGGGGGSGKGGHSPPELSSGGTDGDTRVGH